jgi:DNA-binding FadR family transcriptional regulator
VAIAEAIASRDVDAAREAMRRHLANSQARYRRLAAEAGTFMGPPLTR